MVIGDGSHPSGEIIVASWALGAIAGRTDAVLALHSMGGGRGWSNGVSFREWEQDRIGKWQDGRGFSPSSSSTTYHTGQYCTGGTGSTLMHMQIKHHTSAPPPVRND